MVSSKLTENLITENSLNQKDLESKLEIIALNIAEEINLDLNTQSKIPPICVYGEFANSISKYLGKFCKNTIIILKDKIDDLDIYSICATPENFNKYDFSRFKG